MLNVQHYSSVWRLLIDTYMMSTPADDLFSNLGAVLFVCAVTLGTLSFLRYQATGKGGYFVLLSIAAFVAVPFIGAAPSWLAYLHQSEHSGVIARMVGVLCLASACVTAAQWVVLTRDPSATSAPPDAPGASERHVSRWFEIAAIVVVDTWAINCAVFGVLILMADLSQDAPNRAGLVVSIAMIVIGVSRSAYIAHVMSKDQAYAI